MASKGIWAREAPYEENLRCEKTGNLEKRPRLTFDFFQHSSFVSQLLESLRKILKAVHCHAVHAFPSFGPGSMSGRHMHFKSGGQTSGKNHIRKALPGLPPTVERWT